ncbi:MAG: nicotinate-nucleotide--dimethylbenzimidazole phosphoribosyltransferase [Hyphomicrobiales bacterium]
MTDKHPFDDIRGLIAALPDFDVESAAAAKERNGNLTKPPGSLGKLETIAEWMAGWQGRARPTVEKPLCAVFAGNHGVAANGVSAYPPAVTAQMVANFKAGGAAVNQLCKTFGVGLKVFELALEVPTKDFTQGPAMEEAECVATMAYGMEAVHGEIDLLCIGEMGIANTTSAAAIATALYGGSAASWVGPGTGVEGEALARKVRAVEAGVAANRARLDDPLQVLACLGGRELAAMAGAIIAARMQRIPVIVDGYVATASAAVVAATRPGAVDHCLFSHRSAEPAHGALLARLDKQPLVDLGMRLGEASGAVVAAGIVKAAVNVHNGMATFAEAGVSGKA